MYEELETKLINFEKKFINPDQNDDVLDSRKTDTFEVKKSNIHGQGLFLIKNIVKGISYLLPYDSRPIRGSYLINDFLFSFVVKLLDVKLFDVKDYKEIYKSEELLNKFIDLYLNEEIAEKCFYCYMENCRIIFVKDVDINTEIFRIYGIQYWMYHFLSNYIDNCNFEEFKQELLVKTILKMKKSHTFAHDFDKYCKFNIKSIGENMDKLSYIGINVENNQTIYVNEYEEKETYFINKNIAIFLK